MQTQIWIRRNRGCSFGSGTLIFANVVLFWDVGPALAPSCAPVSQFQGYFVLSSGLCRKELGPYWLYFGHIELCWDILSCVGTILGSAWAILGYFGCCVGLCLGLGHFIVVEFSSMQIIGKKTP